MTVSLPPNQSLLLLYFAVLIIALLGDPHSRVKNVLTTFRRRLSSRKRPGPDRILAALLGYGHGSSRTAAVA
jgi:hypothetical protein